MKRQLHSRQIPRLRFAPLGMTGDVNGGDGNLAAAKPPLNFPQLLTHNS